MPRSKTVVPGRARRKKILKAAKGNFSGRRKLYKSALQTVQRAGQFAYEHRRTKKRDFRALWRPGNDDRDVQRFVRIAKGAARR